VVFVILRVRLGGFAVMARCVLVVVGCLVMMIGGNFRHTHLTSVERYHRGMTAI